MPSEYMTESLTFAGFLTLIGTASAAAATYANIKDKIGERKHGNVNGKTTGDRNGTAFNVSSIARATRDLTMSFPLLCSDTISPSTAALISKAVERNNVSMLQMFIAAYHISANNGIEAIRMVHTNLDNSFRAEDLIDAVMGTCDYKGFFEMSEIKNMTDCTRPPINYTRFLEQARVDFLNTCNIRYPESSFSENSVADYIITNRFNSGISVLKEAKGTVLNDKDLADAVNKAANSNLDDLFKMEKDSYNRAKDALKYTLERRKNSLEREKFNHDKKRERIEDEKDFARSTRELFFRQLLDSDVKKANELQPTLMVVPFYYRDANGNEQAHEFIAGVKSRLITCSSEEIIDQISRFNKNGVNLNNLIRANTKEISFAKEFIGGIEQAKIDAKKNSKLSGTSPIWRMLQRRSSKSGIKLLARTKGSKNAAAAITTLVITAQEADYIMENHGVNINNPAVAREFMESYNLLCLIIVDEQTEIAKFLYDGEKYFADYSFSSLDKDNNSNDTRKLISLLNKTR